MSTAAAPKIVTIDGPSGSGKGVMARLLATRLGWHLLDSGALYRAIGLIAIQQGLKPTHQALPALAQALDIAFIGERILLKGTDVTDAIRAEATGERASQVAAVPAVRAALLSRQRACAQQPGLVADGRDMGTLVFPAAQVKIFLTASANERAKRRYNQLKEKGLNANLTELAAALHERDERDRTRSVAPLKAAAAALVVESTGRSIEDVFGQVLAQVVTIFPELQV